VALELAEVLAGFPLAASFAIAGGIGVLREGRRRSSLNEAMHELRRPLQILALSFPEHARVSGGVDSSLRQLAAAADRLEREINGGNTLEDRSAIALGPLVAAAVERWQVRARRENRSLSLRWEAGDVLLHGNESELEQALDNMISNGFEHGAGEVTVEVREGAGLLWVTVLDRGHRAPLGAGDRSLGLWARIGGRARHGHGLRIVRRVAARHAGSFQLRLSPRGTEARLQLPVAGGFR
jgi:signal transduction histidine kinase